MIAKAPESIIIRGKEYPFFVSSELAIMIGKKTEEATSEADPNNVDLIVYVIAEGLKAGRKARPLFKRFYFVPGCKRLKQLLTVREMLVLFMSIMYGKTIEEAEALIDEEPEEAKKPKKK